jgi:hypothetical protein
MPSHHTSLPRVLCVHRSIHHTSDDAYTAWSCQTLHSLRTRPQRATCSMCAVVRSSSQPQSRCWGVCSSKHLPPWADVRNCALDDRRHQQPQCCMLGCQKTIRLLTLHTSKHCTGLHNAGSCAIIESVPHCCRTSSTCLRIKIRQC